MGRRIVLADDHRILREGLRSLLETQLGHEVVGEAENGLQALALVQRWRPEVVIMDLTMPEMNGLEATRRIKENFSFVKVIALSMHSDKRFVADMLSAGASAYLLKECAFDELDRAMEAVMAGHTYVSAGIVGVFVDDYVQNYGATPTITPPRSLTGKEREILQLYAEGHTTKEIAARYSVSVKTIETHRNNIMDKLQLYTIAELTKYAIREGITPLGK